MLKTVYILSCHISLMNYKRNSLLIFSVPEKFFLVLTVNAVKTIQNGLKMLKTVYILSCYISFMNYKRNSLLTFSVPEKFFLVLTVNAVKTIQNGGRLSIRE